MSLRVRDDGTLIQGGRPFRGFGVNYVGCFWRLLENPADDAFLQTGFAALAKAGIPFARFAACGYWPRDWSLFRRDPREHWRRLDRVVAAAERAGIGLIPSLFWHYATLPDVLREPVSSLGRTGSRTHDLIVSYTRDCVRRYRRSPAIWGWELGNEYNLPADLPNAADHRPPIAPDRGTPKTRTAADELSHDAFRTAARVFAREVRRHDPERLISSGNAFPRPTAWHQKREKSWGPDTEGQFAEMLVADNPSPIDTLGGHLYAEDGNRFGRPFSFEDLLRISMTTARAARKPLFVGEFGIPGDRSDAAFGTMLSAIERSGVPLAALWVYDFPSQDREWNVTFNNERAGQLQALGAANARLAKGKG